MITNGINRIIACRETCSLTHGAQTGSDNNAVATTANRRHENVYIGPSSPALVLSVWSDSSIPAILAWI